MHTRPVLIPLIQLSAMAKLKRESDYNISFVQNSCRPREMKWEDVSPWYIYIYIYIYSSDATLRQQSTKKKIHQISWSRSFDFAKECHIDVVHSFLWFDVSLDEIVTTSSRKRFLYVVVISKRWTTTELYIVQRFRRGRFLEEWSLRNESGRSHQYNEL